MSALLDAALLYAGNGLRVFPCHHPVDGHCSCQRRDCSSPAKHPRTPHGLHDASSDLATVRAWWTRWPRANVAVATGERLFVLDVDGQEGEESLATLRPLPATVESRTASGGRHLFFGTPTGVTVHCSAAKLGPGLDVRGHGGYAILPCSRGVAGDYVWVRRGRVALPPEWLVSLVRKPEPRPVQPISPCTFGGGDGTPYGLRALKLETRRVRETPRGQRNHALNVSAFSLGQLVAGGELSASAARTAGHGALEAARTVRSGMAAGRQWPRQAPKDERTAA